MPVVAQQLEQALAPAVALGREQHPVRRLPEVQLQPRQRIAARRDRR